jgi:hypothetical protein
MTWPAHPILLLHGKGLMNAGKFVVNAEDCCCGCDCDRAETPPTYALVTLAGVTPGTNFAYGIFTISVVDYEAPPGKWHLNTTFTPLDHIQSGSACLMGINGTAYPITPRPFPDYGPGIDFGAFGTSEVVSAVLLRHDRKWELLVLLHPETPPGTGIENLVMFHGETAEMDCGLGTLIFSNESGVSPGDTAASYPGGIDLASLAVTPIWGATGGTATVEIRANFDGRIFDKRIFR